MVNEKKWRLYYQEIVYAVCNLLDTPGNTVVCGTVEEPSMEVEDRVCELLAENTRLREELKQANDTLDHFGREKFRKIGQCLELQE